MSSIREKNHLLSYSLEKKIGFQIRRSYLSVFSVNENICHVNLSFTMTIMISCFYLLMRICIFFILIQGTFGENRNVTDTRSIRVVISLWWW